MSDKEQRELSELVKQDIVEAIEEIAEKRGFNPKFLTLTLVGTHEGHEEGASFAHGFVSTFGAEEGSLDTEAMMTYINGTMTGLKVLTEQLKNARKELRESLDEE